MKLMFDNLVIATQQGTSGNFKFVLEDNVHPFFIPGHLFLLGAREVTMNQFLKFIEGRIFPKERVDCDKLLKELGLNSYKPLSIAEKTKACLVEDGWWVAFSDEDNFRDSTVRGAAGFREWVSVSVPELK